MLRIIDPLVERLVIPNDVRGFERGRITAETRQASRLAVPHIRETRAGHIQAGLQGMTGRASAEYALALGRIAFRSESLCIKRECQQSRSGNYLSAFHDRSPVMTRMSARPREHCARVALSALEKRQTGGGCVGGLLIPFPHQGDLTM